MHYASSSSSSSGGSHVDVIYDFLITLLGVRMPANFEISREIFLFTPNYYNIRTHAHARGEIVTQPTRFIKRGLLCECACESTLAKFSRKKGQSEAQVQSMRAC